jgi:internalin A
MRRQILRTAVVVAIWTTSVILAAEAPLSAGPAKARVLHFPADQGVGQVSLENDSDPFTPEPVRLSVYKFDPFTFSHTSEFVGLARGDVRVPSARPVTLSVNLRLRSEDRSKVEPDRQDGIKWFETLGVDDLSGLSGLAPDDLVQLRVSSLVGMAHVEDRVLRPISRLTGLQILVLSSTGITDEGMKYLRGLRSLRAMELNESQISGPGLAVLKDMPALEYLQGPDALTDAGLKHVAALGQLRWIQLRVDGVRGPGLAELAALPRLERLCLIHPADQHLQYLQGLTRLKGLTLWEPGQPLTDASLAQIGKLTGLEDLNVIGWGAETRFTGDGLAHLQGLRNLRSLDLHGYIDDVGIRNLTPLTGLESIQHVETSAEGMAMLASFKNLKVLDVRLKGPARTRASVGGILPERIQPTTGLGRLAELPSLEKLTVSGSSLSEDDINQIGSTTHLKRLQIWTGSPRETTVTDTTIGSICRLTQLEALDLQSADLTKQGLNQLNCLVNLKSLEVRVSDLPADPAALDLSRLTKLRRLVLGSLQDWDLACLSGLHDLEWLSLGGEISEASLRYLTEMPQLRLLQIYGVTCSSGDGLAQLASLKRLDQLRLSGKIPDAAVARLACLSPSVGSLIIHTSEPIQDQTRARVKQALPRLIDVEVEKPIPVPAGRSGSRSGQSQK